MARIVNQPGTVLSFHIYLYLYITKMYPFMYSLFRLLFYLFIILSFTLCSVKKEETELRSPDGRVKLLLHQDQAGSLFYSVEIKETDAWKEVIGKSPLGIRRKDSDFTGDLSLVSRSDGYIVDDLYKMYNGDRLNGRTYARECFFNFENPEKTRLKLVCRVFNEGIAFHYEFPGKGNEQYEVTGEVTGFNLEGSRKFWMQPYDSVTLWSPAYERFYECLENDGDSIPDVPYGWSFPVLAQKDSYWIYISEAGLTPSYCGTHLETTNVNGLFTIRFPEERETDGFFQRNPVSKLPWKLPWRYILISTDLETILTSNHVNDLSEPSRIHEPGWISTGIATWSWWSESNSTSDPAIQRKYIDFAAKMRWKYCLLDAGWDKMKNEDLVAVIRYAREKNVNVFLWYDSGARQDYAGDEQSRIMFNDSTREREMKRISDLGVRGIKVDFFQSDKQGMIRLYWDILDDAIKYKLHVNFHGCTIPRGWSRTFPNLLAMEAVRGAEAYRYDESYPGKAPVQNTIIPFTRNVAGPMDYTPVTMSDNTYPHITSNAHEIALGLIFKSGIQHFADNYESYEALPALAGEFMSALPVTWDQSKLFSGYPGKEVILGRRKGKDWYIAGINGEGTEKDVDLSLEFLPPGSFDFILISDGNGRDELKTARWVVTRDDTLKLKMQPYGGFSAKTGLVRPLN